MRVGEIWKLKIKYARQYDILGGLKVKIVRLHKNFVQHDMVTSKIIFADIIKNETNQDIVDHVLNGVEEVCLSREDFLDAYEKDYESNL